MQTVALTANALLKVGVDQLEKAARPMLKAMLSSAMDEIFDCTAAHVGDVLLAWTVLALVILLASRLPEIEHIEARGQAVLCLLIVFSKLVMEPVHGLVLLYRLHHLPEHRFRGD
ncbi:hypothetical protein SDRG_02621 [Saprolegnia diclina VS20]|uniref:Uncharacterized protein n=1 Tax=Saprolegnia diclina (strain VS20) TaxID=1156394 RepID=T0R116_SAPDV|nr:hypothetical protein SDRG_02621 [Saprolegnia diclina VS20]EQC39965.1 hypothetical protein SDRG_02621 [Saprolegnia diclina VS20]|eukprot:XP_008606439.1 hypothetical protein SDRG_02621 [Saprolegnia diclina VS20]